MKNKKCDKKVSNQVRLDPSMHLLLVKLAKKRGQSIRELVEWAIAEVYSEEILNLQ